MPQRSEANLLPKPPPTCPCALCNVEAESSAYLERSPPIPKRFALDREEFYVLALPPYFAWAMGLQAAVRDGTGDAITIPSETHFRS